MASENNDKRIRVLAERYLDGCTTAEEERELAAWFESTTSDVPDELKPLAAMFAYIRREQKRVHKGAQTIKMPAESIEFADNAVLAEPVEPVESVVPSRKRIVVPAVVGGLLAAACVLAAVFLQRVPDAERNYAVIDGRVYTACDVVEREALDALQMVSTDEDDSFAALDMML